VNHWQAPGLDRGDSDRWKVHHYYFTDDDVEARHSPTVSLITSIGMSQTNIDVARIAEGILRLQRYGGCEDIINFC
jgi:hypothetical protein